MGVVHCCRGTALDGTCQDHSRPWVRFDQLGTVIQAQQAKPLLFAQALCLAPDFPPRQVLPNPGSREGFSISVAVACSPRPCSEHGDEWR